MPYIKEYNELNPKELRQLNFKRRYKEDQPTWDDSMVLLTKLVRDRLHEKTDVLDLGCGRGNFVLDELGDVFGQKVGIDVSKEATTGNTSLKTIVHTSEARLPFPDESFDLVTSLWVLEHLPHPLTTFQEVSRVLRPGGIFAFVTPNRRSFLIGLRRLMNKKTADFLLEKIYGRKEEDVFDVYYRANTQKGLRNMLEKTGFTIEYLQENGDPSYTSFNGITYQLSKIFTQLPLSLSRPHLIGIVRKRST